MAAELFSEANGEFVAENYQRALDLYTQAIDLDGNQADYFVNRSHAHIKLEHYKDAASDAEKAVQINPKNIKAYLRKGTALLNLKDFNQAREAFQRGAEIDESDTNLKSWLKKCEAEMDGQVPAINETTPPVSPEQSPGVEGGDAKGQVIESPEKPAPAHKTRYDWYQTQSDVIVTVMLKKVKKEDFTANIETTILNITVKLSHGSDYQLNLELAHPVLPEQSVIKLLSSKIEVKLKKAEGIRWNHLENKGEQSNVKQFTSDDSSSTEKPPSYPTSRPQHTDWDKLATQLKEEEKEEKPEGDAALNSLFQQIYSDGTDEVKKAMMKSFYESGGTVLSTNWNEIGKEKTEVKPPDGMEYKKWDG